MEHRCLKEGELGEIKQSIKNLHNKANDNKKEISELKKVYKLIYKQNENISLIVADQNTMKNDVKGIREDVDKIINKPLDTFEHYKRVIIGAIILAVIGAFLAGMQL